MVETRKAASSIGPEVLGGCSGELGRGVANREGHEGQSVLGCGEKVGVWGGAGGLDE